MGGGLGKMEISQETVERIGRSEKEREKEMQRRDGKFIINDCFMNCVERCQEFMSEESQRGIIKAW